MLHENTRQCGGVGSSSSSRCRAFPGTEVSAHRCSSFGRQPLQRETLEARLPGGRRGSTWPPRHLRRGRPSSPKSRNSSWSRFSWRDPWPLDIEPTCGPVPESRKWFARDSGSSTIRAIFLAYLAALWLHLARPWRTGRCQEMSFCDMKRQKRRAAGFTTAACDLTSYCGAMSCKNESGGGENRTRRSADPIRQVSHRHTVQPPSAQGRTDLWSIRPPTESHRTDMPVHFEKRCITCIRRKTSPVRYAPGPPSSIPHPPSFSCGNCATSCGTKGGCRLSALSRDRSGR
jgi:hypothetical protein